MRYILTFLTLLILSFAPPAHAKPVNGQVLYGWCYAPYAKVFGEGVNPVCAGYVSAIADVFSGNNAVNGRRACIPPDTTIHRLREVVVSYLKARPEEDSKPAADLSARALADAFPCGA